MQGAAFGDSCLAQGGFASKVTWTQSVQGAVATWSNEGVKNVRKYRKLITDQVATAPCTDCVQEWFRTFEAKLFSG
jgi:hypothetical protein